MTSLPSVLSQTNGDKGIPAALIYSNYCTGGVQLLQHIYQNSLHSINDLGGLISMWTMRKTGDTRVVPTHSELKEITHIQVFLWVRDSCLSPVGTLLGKAGAWVHVMLWNQMQNSVLHLSCFSASSVSQCQIQSEPKSLFILQSPYILNFHLFHTSCREKVKYQTFLYSSLVKHWDRLLTDRGDSGVGRKEKFEGFLNSLFLISAW